MRLEARITNFVALFCLFVCFVALRSRRDSQFAKPHVFLGKLEQAVNQYLVHILSHVTDNDSAEGRRMTVEIIK